MHKNISTVDFSCDLADAEILSVAVRQVTYDHLAHYITKGGVALVVGEEFPVEGVHNLICRWVIWVNIIDILSSGLVTI